MPLLELRAVLVSERARAVGRRAVARRYGARRLGAAARLRLARRAPRRAHLLGRAVPAAVGVGVGGAAPCRERRQ